MLDLKALLTKMLNTIHPWVQMSKTSFTCGTTVTKQTGLSIAIGGAGEQYFTKGSDQVTIKRAGTYKISINWILSNAVNNTSVKRLSLYKNGSAYTSALSRVNAWQSVQGVSIGTFAVGDVLTMWARCEDGTDTFSEAKIIIEPMFG